VLVTNRIEFLKASLVKQSISFLVCLNRGLKDAFQQLVLSISLSKNVYNNHTHIYDYNIKLIQGYLFCQSFEILCINSLSCFSVFFHITFLEDPFFTVNYIIMKIYVD